MRVSQKRQRGDLSRPLLLLLLCWWKVFHRIIDDAQRHYTRKRPSLSLMLFNPSSRRGPAPPRQPSRLCYLCRTGIFTDTCAMMHREALLVPHAEAERQEVKSPPTSQSPSMEKHTQARRRSQKPSTGSSLPLLSTKAGLLEGFCGKSTTTTLWTPTAIRSTRGASQRPLERLALQLIRGW